MVKTIAQIIESTIPYYKKKGEPEATHTLTYESYTETLEPVYYFILDLMNDFGLKVEKLIDNFSSSPGGTHFGEIGQRKSIMQQQASKLMGDINMVLRSVLNIIWDLKEFRVRLQVYNDVKNKDKKDAATLSLKQIWLDKVDMQKGQGAIHAMAAGNLQFTTLRDAFLAVKDEKDIKKMDLNERVKRVLLPRIQEFNMWVTESGRELKKRYEIERNYLKSQVNSLKLYSRWVKPYLKAAENLESKDMGRDPGLVNAFNRLILELTILGKSKIKVKDAAIEGKLPEEFSKQGFLKTLRKDYHSCILVDFNFRTVPQQGNLLGRADITFRAYALSDDELKKIDEELNKSDLGDVLQLIEGTTTESLNQLQEEINFFLEDNDKEEKIESEDGSNPFLALLGYYNKSGGKETKKESKGKPLVPDNWIEKEHVRKLAISEAKEKAFMLFDIYKKAHGMPSYT